MAFYIEKLLPFPPHPNLLHEIPQDINQIIGDCAAAHISLY